MISTCCGADARVESSSEGTCCYVCEACGKGCDVKPEPAPTIDLGMLRMWYRDYANDDTPNTIIHAADWIAAALPHLERYEMKLLEEIVKGNFNRCDEATTVRDLIDQVKP